MTEAWKVSDAPFSAVVSSRNTLLSLVQGLGIKLPTGDDKAALQTNAKLHAVSPRRYIKRQSGSRPVSPKPKHSPGTRSPKSFSPPSSPRVASPMRAPTAFTLCPVKTTPATSPRPVTSPKPGKPDQSSIKKLNKQSYRRSITMNSPLGLAASPRVTAQRPQIRKKVAIPDAPAPVLTIATQRDYEAAMAMVSPRIDLDSVRSVSPKRVESVEKKVSNRGKKGQESRSLVLKSLVTKAESSSDPTEVGKTKTEAIYRKHLFQTFRGLKLARSIPPADPIQIQAKRIVLMKPPGKYRRKTAIFDLDETLVHCLDRSENAVPDVVLPIRFPNGDIVHANMKVRPYVNECLTQVSQDMEVIVFTASQRSYADAVMNYLDPMKTLIHHRLYRDSCVQTDHVHIKDLRIFANRSLKDTVLVDNAAYSFAYQLDNGIPIVSWADDPEDRELVYLTEYLKGLLNAEDVREVNQQTFHLATFYSDHSEEFLSKSKPKP